MKRKIGLTFAAAAIGFAMVVLAQASIGPEMERASGAMTFSVLQPAW